MEKMLTEICDYLNNYFWRAKLAGSFTISGGALVIPQAKENQYIRIVGSVFNDGVYKYPVSNLINEDFSGEIWLMAVPETVISLAAEIDAWQTKYGSVTSTAMSPYTAESFGNYSYSKDASKSSDAGAGGMSWQDAYAKRLNKWRRLRNLP